VVQYYFLSRFAFACNQLDSIHAIPPLRLDSVRHLCFVAYTWAKQQRVREHEWGDDVGGRDECALWNANAIARRWRSTDALQIFRSRLLPGDDLLWALDPNGPHWVQQQCFF
jgi:hypothetical protein